MVSCVAFLGHGVLKHYGMVVNRYNTQQQSPKAEKGNAKL